MRCYEAIISHENKHLKKKNIMCASLTFVSVGHEDAGHEFLLAVVTEGVPDHDLLLCQLTLKVQGVPPVE